MNIVTHSAQETKDIAMKLAKALTPGTLIILTGDLGAGKTTFTQGLAKGLNIKKNVTSPTFTIMKIYQGRLPLYHIDAYRLEGLSQDLGLQEMMDDDGVCVIEWPIFIMEELPDQYLRIEMTRIDENSRSLKFYPQGKRYEEIMEVLK